ncbi:DUF3396 domain-containing protein [Sesbania bispinosa]|nr:DUF3396 domain-containing protein [Sesbania bispinosa]
MHDDAEIHVNMRCRCESDSANLLQNSWPPSRASQCGSGRVRNSGNSVAVVNPQFSRAKSGMTFDVPVLTVTLFI